MEVWKLGLASSDFEADNYRENVFENSEKVF